MEAALPMKDKEAVTLSEVERDSKEKVVMAVAKVAAIMAVAKDTAIMVVAKVAAIMVAAKDMAITVARDTAITEAAITMVVISDSIVAHPIAIGTMC